jgi:hypothetical protein
MNCTPWGAVQDRFETAGKGMILAVVRMLAFTL